MKLPDEMKGFRDRLILTGEAFVWLGSIGVAAKLDVSRTQQGWLAYHALVWGETINRPDEKNSPKHIIGYSPDQVAAKAVHHAAKMYAATVGKYHTREDAPEEEAYYSEESS